MPRVPSRRKVQKKSPQILFDKYELYKKAVQSPETDAQFLLGVYKELRKKNPKSMREDFCGTFAVTCEWTKLHRDFVGYGVDLDPEPIEYGRLHHFNKLTSQQQKRVHILEGNVLSPNLAKVDVAVALNFSYFIFKKRELMKKYFSQVYKNLNKDGIFVCDIFGGSLCYDENEEKTVHKGFTYYWHQEGFDPVDNGAIFHIHFRIKGKPKIENVFSYDWRMWTIPEIREIMEEVGFQKTHVYWEGTTKQGTGDGVFTRTEKGESCQSWIAYVVGEK